MLNRILPARIDSHDTRDRGHVPALRSPVPITPFNRRARSTQARAMCACAAVRIVRAG